MKFTAMEVLQQKFKTAFKGYKIDEVRAFLELVAKDMEEIITENNFLKDELSRKEVGLNEFKEREENLKQTLLMAQKVTEDIKNNALKEAQMIIFQAELQSEKLSKETKQKIENFYREIEEIKRQKILFTASFKALLDAHSKMLQISEYEQNKDKKKQLDDESKPLI